MKADDFPHALDCEWVIESPMGWPRDCTCHVRWIAELEVRIEELEAMLEACRGEIGHLQARLKHLD